MKNHLKYVMAFCGIVFFGLTLSMAVPAWADIIDSDGFDDQNWNSSQGTAWSRNPGDGSIVITNETAQTGSYSAEMGNKDYNTETLELAVPTTGYTDITVSYYRGEAGNWESQDFFLAEWYDGSSWRTLEQVYNDWGYTFVYRFFTLGAGASGNANFKIRFTHDNSATSGSTESIFLDSIRIEGTPSAAPTFTITASAGLNGSISPAGGVSVTPGADQTFTITPNENYQVAELLVDGLPDTLTGGQYTFSNVTADHTISVTFALIPPGEGDPPPPPSGCASNVSTDYSAGFDPLLFDFANVGVQNNYLVLQTGSQAIDPEHIVIPFTQEVTVTFLYEGTSWLADFGWVRYEDAVDGSGNFIGFENIPQNKLHPIFSNMKDDGSERWYAGNGVFDAEYGNGGFPYNNEAALAAYDDGTGLPFVVDGDGAVTYKDMKKSLGIIEGGTEMVFWLVTGRLSGGDLTQEDADGWSPGGLVEAQDWNNLDPVWGPSAVYFSKKDWNPDTYGVAAVNPNWCNPGYSPFEKIYRLGEATGEVPCDVDRGWLDQGTIDRIAAGWNIVLSGEYHMPVTMFEKYTHVVVGAPPDDPKQWIMGVEDRNYNLDDSDMDHNDVTFRIERKTGGTVQLKDTEAIVPANEDSYYIGVTIKVYDHMDGGACLGKNNITYYVSIDNGTNWVEVDGWDEVKEFTIDGFGNKVLGADVAAWSPGDPEMTYRSRRIDFAGMGLSGRELSWKAVLLSDDDQCVPEIIDVVLDASVAGASNFSRSSPVVQANVLYSGSYQIPSPTWTDQVNRGHLTATRIYDPADPNQSATLELWDAGLELNNKTPGARTIFFPNIVVTAVVNETVGTGDGTETNFTGTLAHQPVSATTLVITDARESFQDKHTKDLEGSLGGIGTINRSTGEFTVTFGSPPDDGVPIRASYSYYTTSSVLLSFTAANVTKEMLGLEDTFIVPDGYVYDFDGDNDFDESDGDWLVNWVRGYRDGASTPKEWLLGAVDHSTPAMITAPGIPQWFYGTATTKAERDDYMVFHSAHADRQSVIFVGALDGMLHAFDAGKFRRDDNPATAGITENRGYFLWEDRTADTPAYCSSTPAECPNYGTGEELWAFIPANLIPRLKNNVLQGDDRAYVDASPAVADVYIGGAWKTVLISAEGIGGDTIFCLDVTDPVNPTFLWEFADPDLFRSRSSPSVAKIGRILQNGTAKWVAFFVSGKTYDATLYPSIYMIDIADGSVVERIFLHGHVDGVGGVPSGQPSVIDSDANGYIDRLYIGTDKGFLYKINIPDDPDTVKYGISSCVINTDFTDENANIVPVDQRLHPIYGSPLAVVENSITTEGTIDYDVRIFFGTGDSPYYDEDINMAATRYYFFAYRDQTKKGECDNSTVFLDWMYELPEGHRIYSSAFAAAGNIYFGTSTAETEDPCEGSEGTALYGLGNIYAFSLSGTKIFEKAVGNSFIAPVVIDKHLYFKSQTADIQSFGSGMYNNKTIISGFPDIDLRFWREIY